VTTLIVEAHIGGVGPPDGRGGDAPGAESRSTSTANQMMTTATTVTSDNIRISRIGAVDRARALALALRECTPTEVGVALAMVADGRPYDDAVVVAIVLAAEMIAARWPRITDWYAGGRFHRNGDLVPSELLLRRYPPNGDVEEWIRYGPKGRIAALREERKAASPERRAEIEREVGVVPEEPEVTT
jgi:hypothetical protein